MAPEKTDGAALMGTAAGIVVASQTLHILGVIAMGALGGATFALMKAPRKPLLDSLWTWTPRVLISFFCSWGIVLLAQKYLLDVDAHQGAEAPWLLMGSFLIAGYKEAWGEMAELFSAAGSLFSKLTKAKE